MTLTTLSIRLKSYSSQRQFYKTLHDILMAYTGTNELIIDYINIPGMSQIAFGSSYSSKFTNEEFNAINHMEDILPKIFSYKFYTFMKLGLMNLYKEQGSVKFQSLVFDKSLLREIMNNRWVKAISTSDFTPYIQDSFVASFDNILGACILFGHLTSIAVIGEGKMVIYTKAPDKILSRFTNRKYQHHANPLRFSTTYGGDVKSFLNNYHIGGIKQEVRIMKNIIGKTAIMKGFSRFLGEAMSPSVIILAGIQLGIDAFRDNPEIWSEKITNYQFSQIFEKLINPAKDSGGSESFVMDPTLNLAQVYTGKKSVNLYKITKDSIRGTTAPFLTSNEFGKLPITSSTLTRYFGNDFYKIQPALYYREYNIRNQRHGSKDLSLQQLLTEEFVHKVRNLRSNFYDILSESYNGNEVIKATFHIEKAQGLGQRTKIYNSLPADIKLKFNELFSENSNSQTFTIRKLGGKVLNSVNLREFATNIAFYLVMFNAMVFIGDYNSGYKLFATQRKIYNDDYITGLYARDNAKAKLDAKGTLMYNEWQGKWNLDDRKTMWNPEDCWPIYLLDDAKELITFFENKFGGSIKPLEK